MKRLDIKPRSHWERIVEEQGLNFHHFDGELYWDESHCYEMTLEEIEKIEDATLELYRICLKTIDYVIYHNKLSFFGFPEKIHPLIRWSWENERDETLYGRFDLCFDGKCEPKMYEFNGDTPTSLLESSVIQWFWLQDMFPHHDQFNSIHEKLLEQWKKIKIPSNYIHFSSEDSYEDIMTVTYLQDTFEESYENKPYQSIYIKADDIGTDKMGSFFDLNRVEIQTLFKLIPLEWMLIGSEFADFLIDSLRYGKIKLIEPVWKMILSNKAILPFLWELNPNHPNLIPCYFEEQKLRGGQSVKKPLWGREGANITIEGKGIGKVSTDGIYGSEGYIYQDFYPLPEFDGRFPVMGSWIIGSEPAGIGIREDSGLITKNTSRFVPHYFIDL